MEEGKEDESCFSWGVEKGRNILVRMLMCKRLTAQFLLGSLFRRRIIKTVIWSAQIVFKAHIMNSRFIYA